MSTRARSVRWPGALLLLAALWLSFGAMAAVQESRTAQLLADASATPPPADRAWQTVSLPDAWARARPGAPASVAWYRVTFQHPADETQPWAAYLPYLYDGGQVWVNGKLAARIPENSEQLRVRWIRPHLVQLAPALLVPGENTLFLRLPEPRAGASMRVPRLVLGPAAELAPLYDHRFFWTSVTPQISTVVCLLASACVLFIWWRRRSEVNYGLFGVASALWGVRTLTFVFEAVPVEIWPAWRMLVHASTGGFIVVMTMLAWRVAGIRKPWFERALFTYWLLGPLWLAAQGPAAEPLVNRWWIGGFLPIGATIVGVSVWSLWRRRTLESAALPATMAIAALAGMHDYMLAWELDPAFLWPWTAHRVNLLHFGADMILVAMGGLLTARFVRTLRSVEEMNQTLEQRVAQREGELALNYLRMTALERENAAAQERQRIMREIHDGMGSQLFVALSRVERGDMRDGEIAEALRGCIAEMRIALDTLAPQQLDFRSTLGNFLFRWRNQLLALGIRPTWHIDVPDEALEVSPHAALQLLRVAQEALTNVVKHAHATSVDVQLRVAGEQLELEVRDNGVGNGTPSPAPASTPGRGVGNMRARAELLGGHLAVHGGAAGMRVMVQVPLAAVRG